MARAPLGSVLRQLRKLVGGDTREETGDGVLLERFAGARDEQAFEELLARHGPMVYGVCRRLVDNEHDAADAYQATFLVLAKKAGSIRKRDAVGSWLYGVAYRVARKARARAGRVRTSDEPVDPMSNADPSSAVVWADLRRVLDDELNTLPRKYRDPLVLCYLEGQTHEQAARSLGWPTGTMSRRVGRGLEWLRERLTRRGVTMPSAALMAVLAGSTARAAVPAALSASTARAAALFAQGAATTGASAPALLLADGALRAFHVARLKAVIGIFVTVGLLGATATAIYQSHSKVASSRGEDGADLDHRLQDLHPTPAERRIDAIGWARDIPDALRLAREHNRPVFLFTFEGNIGTGRCGGSAFNLRANSLADERIIALVNHSFVPVLASNSDESARGGRTRIYHAAFNAGLHPSDECIYLLAPDGKVTEVISIKAAKKVDTLVEKLEQTVASLKTAGGDPLVAPHALSVAPPVPPGGLVLHLVARVDHHKAWSEFPGENWIVLSNGQVERLIDPQAARPGDTWTIDPDISAGLLTHFYPQTENNDLATNRLDRQSLKATVVSIHGDRCEARIEGELRMKHAFYNTRPDDNFVDATLVGVLDFDPATRHVRSLRLITEGATYGPYTFKAGLRSLP
ncbi:hypothetical protein AYO40_00175 [Planctomycetaceae bacterium SCGC AG-212-D15]|nr:hypothetical protein AYO40_00175 [Planctomycetaceae bacterium SCGC AG-212-D15]